MRWEVKRVWCCVVFLLVLFGEVVFVGGVEGVWVWGGFFFWWGFGLDLVWGGLVLSLVGEGDLLRDVEESLVRGEFVLLVGIKLVCVVWKFVEVVEFCFVVCVGVLDWCVCLGGFECLFVLKLLWLIFGILEVVDLVVIGVGVVGGSDGSELVLCEVLVFWEWFDDCCFCVLFFVSDCCFLSFVKVKFLRGMWYFVEMYF